MLFDVVGDDGLRRPPPRFFSPSLSEPSGTAGGREGSAGTRRGPGSGRTVSLLHLHSDRAEECVKKKNVDVLSLRKHREETCGDVGGIHAIRQAGDDVRVLYVLYLMM